MCSLDRVPVNVVSHNGATEANLAARTVLRGYHMKLKHSGPR